MSQPRPRPNPAVVASYIKELRDELVNRHKVPRQVVMHLRLQGLMELVEAFRLHAERELARLMAAPTP